MKARISRTLVLWTCVSLACACGDDSSGEDGDSDDDAGRGGARAAGSSAAGAGFGSRAGAGGRGGSGGSGGAGGRGGAGGSGGSGGTAGNPIPIGPLPDLGYVGCPDFWGCACLIGGDEAQPWHVCAPPCEGAMSACEAAPSASARAECQPQPVNVLGRRFLAEVEGACVLHCDGGLTCPDGLTCTAAGQGTQLCVAPGVVPYPAMLQPSAEPAETPVTAAPLQQLCEGRAVNVDGELDGDDPLYRRAAQDATGCMLAPDDWRYRYDLYEYELVGDGPHELTAHTCGAAASFDTVINVYQDRQGSAAPLDIAAPCAHLLAVADDSVYCEGSASLVRMTGLAAGVVQVMVTSFGPDETGTYQLTVESPTSTCR